MALLHVEFFSEVLQMCMGMDVILPQRTRGMIGVESKKTEEKCKNITKVCSNFTQIYIFCATQQYLFVIHLYIYLLQLIP